MNVTGIFHLQSMLYVLLLMICTCAYVRSIFPGLLDRNKNGWRGNFWKMARIGERASPIIALACLLMAVKIIFWDE